jgi:hypothetical protein
MKTILTEAQHLACKKIYSEMFHLDAEGTALDVDSLNIVNVLAAVSTATGLDLYYLLDNFSEEDFQSLDHYAARLRQLAADSAGNAPPHSDKSS